MFVSFGATAQAAGERSEIYMVSSPRDAEGNKNNWDRDNLQFMNGWYMEAYDMFDTFAAGSYEGKVAYCIEPGTPIDNSREIQEQRRIEKNRNSPRTQQRVRGLFPFA